MSDLSKKEQAKKLAEVIDAFNKGLPSFLFTELHNAVYALKKWVEQDD